MTGYPLSAYELDQHVDAGITNLSGTVDAIPHALAAMIWSIDRHVSEWIVNLFGAAFSVDILSGTSPLRAAASGSARQLYAQVAQPLLTTAIVVAGLWAMWQLLVQRRYADGAGALGVTLGYCLVCMAIVLAPAATIGTLAGASRELSTGVLGAILPSSGGGATRSATDGLRASLIHEPWILLNFGASAHCLDANDDPVEPAFIRSDGTPVAPRGAACLDSHTLAPKFLKHEPGSDERTDAFEDLDDGSALEKRSVRIQTGAAGYDRVALALGLLVAATGAIVLVGGLALGMIAAQLYTLILIGCAPIALLASFLPGSGHHIAGVWLKQLIGAIFRSAVYCLYLSLAAGLSIAVAKAAPTIGSIGALTLQAALWWGLVIYGRTLSQRLAERAVASPALRAASGATQRVIHHMPTRRAAPMPEHAT
ncbi:MAG: hypothetical protein JWL76_363 [Thermoleophilia bacterium]|nr:hypothetical protein [Thermoleophilia bacterium]